MKIRKLLSWLVLLGLSLAGKANPPEEGKTIFLSRCAACHNVNKALTGPALAGVDQRRSIDWIIKFVHSSQTMVKSGDKDAVSIYNQFNKVPMPDHPDLSEDQIKSIVDFIKTEAKPVGEEKAPFVAPSVKKPAYKPLVLRTDYPFFLAFLAVVGVLIAALLFAVKTRSMQRNTYGSDKS